MTALVLDRTEAGLWDAVGRVQARSKRSRQKAIGVSDLAGCRRKGAYKYHRVKPTDDQGPMIAAALGTWLHRGAQDVLRKEFRAKTEVTLVHPLFRGHADALYDLIVEDIKSRSTYTMDQARREGGRPSERLQGHGYAWLMRSGLISDRRWPELRQVPVEVVRLRFIDRNDGSEWIVDEPFSVPVVSELLDRLGRLGSYETPEDAPRDEDGPGLSIVCDSCPFRSRCWPASERSDRPQAAALDSMDRAAIETTLLAYETARVEEAEAKKQKAFFRAMLDKTAPGDYGSMKLTWGADKPGKPGYDVPAMVALLEAAGVTVPMTEGKPSSGSIGVARAKQVTPGV